MSVLWEQALVLAAKHVESDAVKLAFDCEHVPGDLPQSELPLTGHYHDWQLLVTAEGQSESARHTFSLPVFPRALPHHGRATASTKDGVIHRVGLDAGVAAQVSAWNTKGAWAAAGIEVGIEDTDLVLTTNPPLAGIPWKLGFLLSLSLFLMAGGMLTGDVVAIGVTGVFGFAGLLTTCIGAYVLMRTVEVRARQGQLSRRCTIFGRRVEDRAFAAGEILEFALRDGGELFSGRWGYGLYLGAPNTDLPLVRCVQDRSLVGELREALVKTIYPRPLAPG